MSSPSDQERLMRQSDYLSKITRWDRIVTSLLSSARPSETVGKQETKDYHMDYLVSLPPSSGSSTSTTNKTAGHTITKRKGVMTPEKKLRTLLRKKAACKGAEVGAVDKAKVCLQVFAKDDPTYTSDLPTKEPIDKDKLGKEDLMYEYQGITSEGTVKMDNSTQDTSPPSGPMTLLL